MQVYLCDGFTATCDKISYWGLLGHHFGFCLGFCTNSPRDEHPAFHGHDNQWLWKYSLVLQNPICRFEHPRAKTKGGRHFSNQVVQMHQGRGETSGNTKRNCDVHQQRVWEKGVEILWHVVQGAGAAAIPQGATACQNPQKYYICQMISTHYHWRYGGLLHCGFGVIHCIQIKRVVFRKNVWRNHVSCVAQK